MANRYFINGGVDNNWGSTSNWSTTSGGAGGSAVPLSTDDVFFDSSSPNCTVNTSARVAKTLDCTGYTNTITMTQGITASGSVTLSAAMTIAGSGSLTVNATATLTSNGKTWPNALTPGAVTITLADNWQVGSLTISSSGGTTTFNGNQLGMSSLSVTTTRTVNGSSLLLLNGTGTVNVSSGTINCNTTINSSGTVTISSLIFGSATLTYIAGTVVTTGSAVTFGSTTTFACSGISWNNLTFNTPVTWTGTLSEDLNLTGTLSLSSSSNALTLNGSTINCGAIVSTGASGGSLGTTVLKVRDTCTISAVTTGPILNPITIDAPGETVTVSGTFRANLGQLKYVAGTVVTDAGTWSSGGGSSPNYGIKTGNRL